MRFGCPADSRTPAPPGADPTENISYVGAQDGYAYAIKASVSAGTAQQVWKTSTQLGTTLQGGTAVWLQTLGSFQGGFTNSDVVFVGTSNTGNTSSNKVYALRADTGATVCFVIGDSAPYGVYVPVVPWLGALAEAAGFHAWRFEETRQRNIKWKNRKHRVPLKEGRLWVEG